MGSRWWAVAPLAFSTFAPVGATAQTLTANQADIPPNVGVADRQDETFQPIGGRLGSFFLYPTLDLSATATDNVLALKDDRKGDVFATARAGARLQSTGGVSRYLLTTFVQQDLHAKQGREDTTQFGGEAFAAIGSVGRHRILVDLAASRTADSRESIENVPEARSPVKRVRVGGDLGAEWNFGRLRVETYGRARRVDLSDAISYSGALLDQDFRDYTLYGARVEAQYRIDEVFRVVGRTTVDRFDFDFGPNSAGFVSGVDADRDSTRLRAEGGIGFERTDKLYGAVTVGYLARRFTDQPLPLRDSGSFSFTADLLWNPDRESTLSVAASREFLEGASRNFAGYRSTGGTVRFDRLLTPRLLATVSGRFAHIVPIGLVPALANSIGPRDEYGATVGARYRLNRRYSIAATYRYSDRDADAAFQPFSANFVSASLRATF